MILHGSNQTCTMITNYCYPRYYFPVRCNVTLRKDKINLLYIISSLRILIHIKRINVIYFYKEYCSTVFKAIYFNVIWNLKFPVYNLYPAKLTRNIFLMFLISNWIFCSIFLKKYIVLYLKQNVVLLQVE